MPFPAFPHDANGIDVVHDHLAQPFLKKVQGNILKGHGREHARVVFFRFGTDREKGLSMLADAASSEWVTSAWSQREFARRYEPKKLKSSDESFLPPDKLGFLAIISKKLFGSLALTRWGLAALGCVDKDGAAPPTSDFAYRQAPTSFSLGMRHMLSPAAHMPPHFTADWQDEYTDAPERAIHGMFLLACDNEDALTKYHADLVVWLRQYDIDSVHVENGVSWRHNGRMTREAFGFVDGISVPKFFAEERTGQNHPERDWIAQKLSDAFITPEQSAIHAGGSYMAFLKFDQDVRNFRAQSEKIEERLEMGENGFHYAPALLVGRLRDGCPLHHGWKTPLPSATEFNNFDFADPKERDPATSGCPFHAHIRKMNPRVDDRDGAGDQDRIIRSQPIRRGMVYDDRGELRGRGNHRRQPWPKGGCGLLFMAYMNDISRQFERLHNDWAIDPNFPHPGNGQLDGVLEAGAKPWNWRGTEMPPVERFVKRLGGHYFYVPSISWLENRGYLAR